MSFVNPISATGAAGSAGAAGAAAGQSGGVNQLANTQTFLNLLVAQLKNQNPDNPTNPTSFMTEIAQLTAVQSQTNLNAEEQTVAADSMIGRTVTGNGASGQQISGTVTGVLLSSSGPPQLQISDPAAAAGSKPTTISLDAVTRVYSATTAATTPTSTGTSGSGTAAAPTGGSTASTTSSSTTTPA